MTIAELKQNLDHALITLASVRRCEEWALVEQEARWIATCAHGIQLEMRADEAGVVANERGAQ